MNHKINIIPRYLNRTRLNIYCLWICKCWNPVWAAGLTERCRLSTGSDATNTEEERYAGLKRKSFQHLTMKICKNDQTLQTIGWGIRLDKNTTRNTCLWSFQCQGLIPSVERALRFLQCLPPVLLLRLRRLANVDKDRNMQLLPHTEWRKGWNGEDMSVVKKGLKSLLVISRWVGWTSFPE